MKSPDLAKHYDKLSVWERVPLLVAARERKDETELQRLLAAAPISQAPMHEHLFPELGVHLLATQYVCDQLERAGVYFLALMKVLDETNPHPEQEKFIADVHAYLFTVDLEAWRMFCRDLSIDPSALTKVNHEGWFLPYVEERMPTFAPNAEAMKESLRQDGQEDFPLVNAEGRAEWYRQALNDLSQIAPPFSKGRR